MKNLTASQLSIFADWYDTFDRKDDPLAMAKEAFKFGLHIGSRRCEINQDLLTASENLLSEQNRWYPEAAKGMYSIALRDAIEKAKRTNEL
jgi:hypothetical protein